MGETAVTLTIDRSAFAEALADTKPTPQREALVKALDESPEFRAEVRALLERLDGSSLTDLVESKPTPLAEAAVAADGTALVKLIAPGWGSTGYYSPEVLERDVPSAFPAGTKMFWDHPTDKEAKERPEGSLDRLAAELVEAPVRRNGPAGDGMYARAKVFGRFAEAVSELAPHIGVSIRGRGVVKSGAAEGKSGPIVDELTEGVSVDFVTMPGAGGRVVEMFEAAGRGEAAPRPVGNPEGEEQMGEIEEARRRADEAEAKLAEAEKGAREEREARERAELAVAVTVADRKAREALEDVKLPTIAKERIVASITENPPMADGKLDDAKLSEAVKVAAEAERKYLADVVGSGKVTGLGESEHDEPEGDDEALGKALEAIADSRQLDGKVREAFLAGRK